VRNALRMRPDRIIVGEVRGGEALDMMQAMNTGHEGSISTVHANSTRDCLSRLETVMMMADVKLSPSVLRQQIAAAIHLIIQLARFTDGTRKLVSITEVTGMEGPTVCMQDLFLFEARGLGEGGKVIGSMRATGIVPKFMDRFAAMGIPISKDLFIPGR
jgi:pilus assembly protein CpaF